MPIMTDKGGVPPKDTAIEPVRTQPADYAGVTVDTKKENMSSLTTFLAGQSWAVDYYRQILNKNDGLNSLQVGLSSVYQQYELIRGMELKVTTALNSPSQNTESAEMILTGAANVYGVLIPNQGDMFIADIGDGREGLFTVTGVTRKSIYQQSAHEIEYKVVSYNTAQTAADLQKKVQSTKYFDRDYLRAGYNPLLDDETIGLRRKLDSHYARLLAMYFNDFFSREVNTLIVPNQARVVYDAFITLFLRNVLGTTEHPALRQMKSLNVYNDQAMYEFTIWSCLERMDITMLQLAAQEMVIVPTTHFASMPMFNSIYYSRCNAAVYPKMNPTNVDATHRSIAPMPNITIKQGTTRFKELDRLVLNTELVMPDATGPVQSGQPPAIKPVTVDDFYVFSEDFYRYDPEVGKLSRLEKLTLDALQGKPLDLKDLENICATAHEWENVERFYYFPVLFVLLKVYPRGL